MERELLSEIVIQPGTGKALELLEGQVLRVEQVAEGGQCADFSRVVGFAVFVGCVDGDRATSGFVGCLEAVGETLAVVVVGVGHRDFLDAEVHQDFRHHDALTRIRRGGAEEQAVVFVVLVAKAGRCGRGRYHDHAVRHGNVGQGRTGDT